MATKSISNNWQRPVTVNVEVVPAVLVCALQGVAEVLDSPDLIKNEILQNVATANLQLVDLLSASVEVS